MADLTELYALPEVRELLFGSSIGLEKENIRVNEQGTLVYTPHPFGNKSQHPFIITDYSESQIEINTEVCNNPDLVYDQLENLHDIVTTTIATRYLEPEYLWPVSNPPLFGDEAAIPIAIFDAEHQDSYRYRQYLDKKYGKKLMLYSGIHYNFSFPDALIAKMHQMLGRTDDLKFLKSEIYMRMAKNCYLCSWFPVYMTAASPIFHESFLDEGESVGGGRFLGYSSMRNSPYGYWNKRRLHLDYTTLDTYVDSLDALVASGELYSAAEFYSCVRLKPSGKYQMKALREKGVDHIELRMFDLNPLDKNGMSREDMELMEYFLFYLATLEDFDYTPELQDLAFENHVKSAAYDPDSVTLTLRDGSTPTLRQAVLDLLDKMLAYFDSIQMPEAIACLTRARQRAADPEQLYSHRVYRAIQAEGYIPFGIRRAKEALEVSNGKYYQLSGFSDLELATQQVIKACLKLGVKYEVLDRKDNFLRLTKNGRTEYVKNATKTSRDNSAAILLMRNRYLSMRLLREAGLPTPEGVLFTDPAQAEQWYDQSKGKSVVIRPNFPSYGQGVTIFTRSPSREDYLQAVKLAFSRADEVLIEGQSPGQTYRLLVIGGEVQAVSKRIPASVTGDGERTIRQLILETHKDPRRGAKNTRPLAFIGMGAEEELHLKIHGMSFQTVPAAGEVVFLRQNPNAATGADSIDCTDIVHETYKQAALWAARVVGGVFCGVDLVTTDVTAPCQTAQWAITGVNFNPSILIHCYPTEGVGRPIGETIVKYLFDL